MYITFEVNMPVLYGTCRCAVSDLVAPLRRQARRSCPPSSPGFSGRTRRVVRSALIRGTDTWSAAWGWRTEHGVPNTPTTVFEAGSVSKQFTAAATLILVERGQISLEDDIRKYFPELPVYEKPITVRELMNHTSGLRDWGEVEAVAGWPRTTREYTHAYVLEI